MNHFAVSAAVTIVRVGVRSLSGRTHESTRFIVARKFLPAGPFKKQLNDNLTARARRPLDQVRP
jgi:hypothetical protein